jgi:undecaprenyl-diphosphatase
VGWLIDVDRTLLEAAAGLRTGAVSALAVVVSAWWFKGLVLTGLGGLLDLRARRPPWSMVIAGAAAGVAAAVAVGLKEAFDRARPPVADPSFVSIVPPPGSDSFPSGHAAEAFAAATVLGALHPRLRVPAFVLAAVVALSRVYLGVHYPADVVVGAALGIVLGAVVVRIARRVASVRSAAEQEDLASGGSEREPEGAPACLDDRLGAASDRARPLEHRGDLAEQGRVGRLAAP